MRGVGAAELLQQLPTLLFAKCKEYEPRAELETRGDESRAKVLDLALIYLRSGIRRQASKNAFRARATDWSYVVW